MSGLVTPIQVPHKTPSNIELFVFRFSFYWMNPSPQPRPRPPTARHHYQALLLLVLYNVMSGSRLSQMSRPGIPLLPNNHVQLCPVHVHKLFNKSVCPLSSQSGGLETWHFSFLFQNKDGKVDKSLVNLRWYLLYNCLTAITTSTTDGGILPYYLYLMILP